MEKYIDDKQKEQKVVNFLHSQRLHAEEVTEEHIQGFRLDRQTEQVFRRILAKKILEVYGYPVRSLDNPEIQKNIKPEHLIMFQQWLPIHEEKQKRVTQYNAPSINQMELQSSSTKDLPYDILGEGPQLSPSSLGTLEL